MAACPSCKAPIEPEADLCLECGEPLGDSPAAKAARAEAAAPPPLRPPATPASALNDGRVRAAAPPMRPTMPATGRAKRKSEDDIEPIRCPGCGVPSRAKRCGSCGAVLRKDDD